MRFILCFLWATAFALDFQAKGEHVILINGHTGAVLYEKNGFERCHPASTTKIATALYALHLRGHDLDSKMTVKREAIRSITPQAKKQSKYRSPPHWLETDGTHIGLKKGEEMPLHDLLHAVLLSSANDACNVIAENIAGHIPTFVENMNHFLKKIGCKETHFNSPSGFTHPEHLTTAYDLAWMFREALQYPFFREIIGKTRYACPETNLEYQRYLVQTNRLVKNGAYFYPKALGGKTGTTETAGVNLVAAAEENGRLLIGAFLNYRRTDDLYTDAKNLFETAFTEPLLRRTLLVKGEQKFTRSLKGARTDLQTYLPEDLCYDYYPSEEEAIRLLVHWKLSELPIVRGEEIGRLEIVAPNGKIVKTATLYAYNGVSATLWHRISCQKKFLFALLVFPFVFIYLRFRKR